MRGFSINTLKHLYQNFKAVLQAIPDLFSHAWKGKLMYLSIFFCDMYFFSTWFTVFYVEADEVKHLE